MRKAKKRPIKRLSQRKLVSFKALAEYCVAHLDQHGDNEDESDIMNHLDYRKLEMIYNDYELLGGSAKSLDIKTFIAVMLHHLPPPKDRVKMVRNLIELFKEIDVNHDGGLEWVEFTSHIIELGMVKKDRVFIDAIKNYYPSPSIKDGKHDTEIEHMYYLDKLKHLIVMERDSKRFKVYNAKTGKFLWNAPAGKNAGAGGAFIAADYIEGGHKGNIKYVATTSSNNSINFWDSNNYMFRDRINTSDI